MNDARTYRPVDRTDESAAYLATLSGAISSAVSAVTQGGSLLAPGVLETSTRGGSVLGCQKGRAERG